MFVTLKENIPTLGKAGDTVKVSDSYARNFLIPEKKAFIGKQEAFSAQQAQLPQHKVSREIILSKLHSVFSLSLPANEAGGLYKKISMKEIQHFIGERIGIPEKLIKLEQHETLHAVGSFQIQFSVQGEQYSASMTINRKQ